MLRQKRYDKRADFDYEIVNYPHLSGGIPALPHTRLILSQLVHYSRACCEVSDFKERNLLVSSKLLRQGFRDHKLCRTFLRLYRRYGNLLDKYNTTLTCFLNDGTSQPVFMVMQCTNYVTSLPLSSFLFMGAFDVCSLSYLVVLFKENLLCSL